MEAIILAGGLGTRLRSVISEVPKCMAPVAGKPFLWYLLKFLTKYDVNRVILSVGYLREVIFRWIDSVKEEFPYEIDYAIEELPLGTGGGIKLGLTKTMTNDVIVLNGDTFFDVNLDKLMEFHSLHSSSITLSLKPMQNFDRYGRVIMNDVDHRIIKFEEKKYCKEGFINGGIYVINKSELVFENLPEKFSFEATVLESQCKFGNLFGIVQNGYFIDIGIPEDFYKADMYFSSTKYVSYQNDILS